MNIKGICWIANEYNNKTQKDITKHDNNAYSKMYANGCISWTDKSKDSNGAEVKVYTNKRFICFDANTIDVLYSHRKELLEIEGRLVTRPERIDKKTGEKKNKFEQVIITKASRYLRQESDNTPPPATEPKAKEEFVGEIDDDIPF